MVKEGIFEPLEYLGWAVPIVPVRKSDGYVRICGEYKVTVNKVFQCDKYPVPRTEDLATLNGGERFSKLDLSHAYQQLVLDESSGKYLTVNIHKGLFQHGILSAAWIFQREMEKRLSYVPFTVLRMDDILISGKNDNEHFRNLENVLDIVKKSGLRLKKKKCLFMASEVTYLGFRINKNGVNPLPEKVADLLNAKTPKNTTQLKS